MAADLRPSQDGNSFMWIPGGAVRLTQGAEERASANLDESIEKTGAPNGASEVQAGSSLNVEWTISSTRFRRSSC